MTYVASGYVAEGYVQALPAPPIVGYPSPSNVRLGVVYGAANEYTGTYSTPGAQDIAAAVLVQLMSGAIPANMVQVRGQPITGTGSEADPWGP